jgi:hypothetical protein
MFRKGELHWDMLGKVILVLIFLMVALFLVMVFKDKGMNAISVLKDIITFGG